MLQAGSERPLTLPAGSLWVPGMGPYGGASPSARALEIARRREEMLGMLHGLPESEYELSLTDLVEKTAGARNNAGVAHPLPLPPPPPPPSERKEAGQPSPLGRPAGLSESGRQAEQQPAVASKRGSSRRRGDSGSGGGRSSFRSSSDGVLLNFYMPRSFTRSFTAPRPSACARRPPPSPTPPPPPSSSPRTPTRGRETATPVKCWLMPWDRRWRKSSRRDQAGESAAILQSSAPAEEKV